MMRFGANRDSYTNERTASHDGKEKSHTASVRIDRVRSGWPSSSDTTLRTRRVVLGKGDREGTLLTFYFRFDAVSTISKARAALPSDPRPDTIRWQPDGCTRYSSRLITRTAEKRESHKHSAQHVCSLRKGKKLKWARLERRRAEDARRRVLTGQSAHTAEGSNLTLVFFSLTCLSTSQGTANHSHKLCISSGESLVRASALMRSVGTQWIASGSTLSAILYALDADEETFFRHLRAFLNQRVVQGLRVYYVQHPKNRVLLGKLSHRSAAQ